MITLIASRTDWLDELMALTPPGLRAPLILSKTMTGITIRGSFSLNGSVAAATYPLIREALEKHFPGAAFTVLQDTIEASFDSEKAAIEWRLSYEFGKVSFETVDKTAGEIV